MNRMVAHYESRVGASMTKSFYHMVVLGRWLERQKRPVTVKLGDTVIGGVERRDLRWHWWYDPTPERRDNQQRPT